MTLRPQILLAIAAIAILGGLVVTFTPEHVDKVVVGAITTIGMLGMKLLEGE